MDESVRFATLDGLWEVGGTARARGIWPEGLACVANKKGPDTSRFILRREPGMPWPDLLPYTPFDVLKNGRVIFEGFTDDSPEEDDYSIAVQGLGWQHHLDHDTYQKAYVHAKLTEWRDTRSVPTATLGATGFCAVGQVNTGEGAIQLSYPNASIQKTNQQVGAYLDLGPTSTAKRVVLTWEAWAAGGANQKFTVRGYDTPDATGAFDTIFDAATAVGPTTTAATLTTARRYIHVILYYAGADGVAAGADVFVKITSALVFADTAYESGNASILKADVILKDALIYAPLIDGEQSGIEAQTFNFPEFAMTDDRTPGEVGDALDAVTNGIRKIQQPGRRPILKAVPTVPILRAGPWEGSTFKDSSKNSGREIYNKAIARGTGPAGEQMRIERYAGQQASALGDFIDVFSNPSFDTNTTGWTVGGGVATFVRDTGIFDSTPASGKWGFDAGVISSVTTTLSGTFKKNVAYRLTFRYRRTDLTKRIEVLFGDLVAGGDYVLQEVLLTDPVAAFYTVTVVWVPKADKTGVKAQLVERPQTPPIGGSAYIDSFAMEIVRPTLVDRRTFVRTKVHSMSQAINTAVGQQIADTFLQTHKRAPLKGELNVTGRGGVRRYLGDAAVEPAELLLYTGELIHLSDQIDPDLGTIGRDGVIAAVTYNGDDETATVAIDNQRDNFEAAVERYQVVAGAGR